MMCMCYVFALVMCWWRQMKSGSFNLIQDEIKVDPIDVHIMNDFFRKKTIISFSFLFFNGFRFFQTDYH